MSRTFVIGDIHGALKALEQLLEKIKPSADDVFIFLGDYVDGWSDSANVISFLIKLKEKYSCLFIRGNHDELCYTWLTQKKNNPEWIKHGGQTTIDAYQNLDAGLIESHLHFFESLHNFYIDTNNRLFLHAGFTNLNGPHREYFKELFYWDRTLWETALALDPNMKRNDPRYPKRLTLFDEIYIGHTPVSRINKTTPVNATCIWNVDTAAAFKGPLTALEIHTKEFWQSDPVHTLYPDEDGRN